MLEKCDYRLVRDMMLEAVYPVDTETIPLEEAAGRVLAQELVAAENVPSFNRSPYDGYAFRAEDAAGASKESPVTLKIIDYIPAGHVPHARITQGTAAHLMTGAPVPDGADAVLPFEKTAFTETEVSIFAPVSPGSNVILAGEDVLKGTKLAVPGVRIDAGLAGVLAGQGQFRPLVYRKPLIGIISTGTEIVEETENPGPGKIYNTNRYSLQAACALAGCRSIYIGTARDDVSAISAMIGQALESCDAVILSGGVSVGDLDCTPEAMEQAGVTLLARGVAMKPGMAGAYGIFRADDNKTGDRCGDKDRERERAGICGIPVFALSGNPTACMTAFYAVAMPALKKRMGLAECLPVSVRVSMDADYQRKKQSLRLLRGRIDFTASTQKIMIPEKQGNQMLSSLMGCNAFAVIPAGESVAAGETTEAFLMD